MMEEWMEGDVESDAVQGSQLDSEDSEVEVYPVLESESDNNTVPWGTNATAFYDGDVHSSDDLEKSEVDAKQSQIYFTLEKDDFESPWLEAVKESRDILQRDVQEAAPIILERVITSFQDKTDWLAEYGSHLSTSCTSSLFLPEGNLYVQSKMHLLFCYCLNALFYLWQKMNNNTHDHLVAGQMSMFNKLLSVVGKLDIKLESVQSKNGQFSASREQTHRQTCPETNTNGKRVITFEMARNKGILPMRKKEQRNPRVKHRNKYRKALIRRKSQVPSVISELQKYGGELSGIRSKVTRSIQIR